MLPYICQRWGDAPMIAVALASPDARLTWPDFGADSGCSLTRLELRMAGALDTAEAYPINWLRNQGIACVKTTHYFV